jgi:hypothetical protein
MEIDLNFNNKSTRLIALHVYVKFTSFLRQVTGFLLVLQFPLPIKLPSNGVHDVAKILKKVAFNTNNQILIHLWYLFINKVPRKRWVKISKLFKDCKLLQMLDYEEKV